MARGISLHVGVNFTSVSSSGLLGCVRDAIEMAAIAEQYGFEDHEVVADSAATFQYVTDKIKDAATKLGPGDIFFFTFSGHGGYIPDEDRDEGDFLDETLALYDFMICDDYFANELWPQFAAGVRILMIADSCHSGTVAQRIVRMEDDRAGKEPPNAKHRAANLTDLLIRDASLGTTKTLPHRDAIRHFALNKSFYQETCRNEFEKRKRPDIGASVLLISACEDYDTTADGYPNSVFTQALLDVVRGQSPPASYTQLVADVAARLVATQVPQLTPVPVKNPAFEAQIPFTI